MSNSDEDLKQGMIGDIGDMDSIIGQFLDFARTQSEEALEDTDLAALAREVVDQQLRLGRAVQASIEPVPAQPPQTQPRPLPWPLKHLPAAL